MSAIELRPTERRQLNEFYPDILDRYDGAGLDDKLGQLMDIQRVVIDDSDGNLDVELVDDDWTLLCRALDKVDDTRAAWLSSKIARRAGLGVDHMAFSTSTPIGPYWAGQKPVLE